MLYCQLHNRMVLSHIRSLCSSVRMSSSIKAVRAIRRSNRRRSTAANIQLECRSSQASFNSYTLTASLNRTRRILHITHKHRRLSSYMFGYTHTHKHTNKEEERERETERQERERERITIYLSEFDDELFLIVAICQLIHKTMHSRDFIVILYCCVLYCCVIALVLYT